MLIFLWMLWSSLSVLCRWNFWCCHCITKITPIFSNLFPLQVVVAPILLGSSIQTAFPSVVQFVTPFAPLMAVLASSLLASRFISFKFTMPYWLGIAETLHPFTLSLMLQCLLWELCAPKIDNCWCILCESKLLLWRYRDCHALCVLAAFRWFRCRVSTRMLTIPFMCSALHKFCIRSCGHLSSRFLNVYMALWQTGIQQQL